MKRTLLYDTHVALGGRMVPFAGWEMPVQYEGIIAEARAVRTGVGLFDVSHMGRLEVSGPGAASTLDRVFSSDPVELRIRRARYGVICNEEGGIIDDTIVYRLGKQRFLVVPNASNAGAVVEWVSRWKAPDTKLRDLTSDVAMIAVQGPAAAKALDSLATANLSSMRLFRAVETEVAGVQALLARTGYTGEDGFEIVLPSPRAAELWSLLMEGGASPCGLGARDVLRLEAGLLLHGNDMDVSTNPYEAGLDRFVDPDRDGYVAGEALRRIRDDGTARRIVGFRMVGRGIARHDQAILDGAARIGTVTSGSHSPTLDTNIGLGYVPTGYSAAGTRFHVDVRGRMVEAEVTALPFYSRKRNP